MKLLALNGSPRRGMNTAQLLEKVVEGARSKGAEAELIHLRDHQYTGCISCFHCKDPKGSSYGRCIKKDGLTPILDLAHEAEALALGSPFYFNVESAFARAFQERLWFQYLLYSNLKPPLPPLSPRKKATALLYTMNVKEEDMEKYGKTTVVNVAKGVMERLFGVPCELFFCTDTKQVKDYSRYEMDLWDIPAKEERRRSQFPHDLERAFEMGARLAL